MRIHLVLWLLVLCTGAGLVTLSFTAGQEDPAKRQLGPSTPLQAPFVADPRAGSKLPPLQQQMFLSAQSGADWLCRANRPDGRFEYGFLPCLKGKIEGDHYLRQAGAAFAMARAARLTGNQKHAAVARQAILTLLLDTTTSTAPTRPGMPVLTKPVTVRHTTLPSIVVNRLGAAALLILAISEVPDPAEDLLGHSEELCAYIRSQQQADGSLSFGDNPAETRPASHDPDGMHTYPGMALYALMRSQAHRPAEWKMEVVRKALAYYRPWWSKNKSMAFVPWQTGACAEAFLLGQGKEQPFADFVFEMNDWICGLQYTTLDPRQPLWLGGFMAWVDGKPVPVAPQIGSACYAEGLVDACRAARQTGDLNRYRRYREGVGRCMQFLTTLQYTDANTQHFADWYRPRLVGGFYVSHQDGTLRIDCTQQAVCALVHFLTHVGD